MIRWFIAILAASFVLAVSQMAYALPSLIDGVNSASIVIADAKIVDAKVIPVGRGRRYGRRYNRGYGYGRPYRRPNYGPRRSYRPFPIFWRTQTNDR